MINTLFGTSPVTTIIGYVTAIYVAVLPILKTGDFDIKRDWPNLVGAALAAIWGRRQKDTNGIAARQDHIIKDAAIQSQQK